MANAGTNARWPKCPMGSLHCCLARTTAAGTHLVNFVPLGMEALLDRLALKELVADLQHAVRVRLALDQASEKLVLPFQVEGLQEVNPQDPLSETTARPQRILTESSRICPSLHREHFTETAILNFFFSSKNGHKR